METLIKIEIASHQELINEYSHCEVLWSKYSCDCLGYYMQALHKRIVELGGWNK